MPKVTVVLIDDHMLVRKGVCSILDTTDDIEVVGETDDGEQALELIRIMKPDVVVLDLQIPGSSGAELCWKIAQLSPQTAVLILSAFLNPLLLKTCLAAGARGYVLKNAENLDIVSAIRSVASGGTVFDQRVQGLEQELFGNARSLFETLTPRELQLVSLLGKGLTNAEISSKLNITLNTTKGHIKEIMLKFDCRNRVEIVIKAREENLI
ncbi:MAG: response regulator transcription factor [Coriobacteriales bacterium]|jgi:DNA-binding NarL/FixJ family response regulator|nr:response regulator transcription factor [Coriobacteriales bacterium]